MSRSNLRVLVPAVLLIAGLWVFMRVWLHPSSGAAPNVSVQSDVAPTITADAMPSRQHERSPAADVPLVQAQGDLVSRPAQEQGSDEPKAPPALEPSEVDALYASFLQEYGEMDVQELHRALKALRDRESELTQPIATERFNRGNYRTEGPLGGEGLILDMKWPRIERPSTTVFSLGPGDDGLMYGKYVEIFPYELPQLAALRQEEAWLWNRIEELKASQDG